MSEVPASRLRTLNEEALKAHGGYVLYWMTAYRRPCYNFALQRAVEHALQLDKPLLIFEPLDADYPYASDRLHQFILQGMAANAEHFLRRSAFYYPFVATEKGAGQGLLEALAKAAAVVIADDHPGFFFPRMLRSVADSIPVRFEAVDSNGLLPLRATETVFPTAYAFRRFLQKQLPGHLFETPLADPLEKAKLPELGALPKGITERWPVAPKRLLSCSAEALAQLPIDHSVAVSNEKGGWKEANVYLQRFLEDRLPHYLQRSEPERQVASELSPFLHFGQISAHQIAAELFNQERWSIARLSPEVRGKRRGWWGLTEPAESFLDELITWREVGFNAATHLVDYDRHRSLPEWARISLARHRDDPRPYLYRFETLEQAQSHDPLWNAAQQQLLREGRMQNYLRMLWGKKILEWSPDSETALQTMLTLNDKYALDGRDPNSVSGIFWCLGRYDRAWGPERPIFGKIRYMSSENTARKFKVKGYLQRYAPD
jgi:deoxyribodipyrimidine photo-lyase